jgi:hypothetical protein
MENSFEHGDWTFRFHKGRCISWLAEQLLVSRERLIFLGWILVSVLMSILTFFLYALYWELCTFSFIFSCRVGLCFFFFFLHYTERPKKSIHILIKKTDPKHNSERTIFNVSRSNSFGTRGTVADVQKWPPLTSRHCWQRRTTESQKFTKECTGIRLFSSME